MPKYTCAFCGHTGNSVTLQEDHSKPKSRGGTDHPNNLQHTCRGCNQQKGTKTSAEYRRWRKANPDKANVGP